MLNGVPMTVRLSSLMLVITHWMRIDMEWYGQATIYWLVVWNMNFIFPHIGNNHPIWLIFFRGVETTTQFICVFPQEKPLVFTGVFHVYVDWKEVCCNNWSSKQASVATRIGFGLYIYTVYIIIYINIYNIIYMCVY